MGAIIIFGILYYVAWRLDDKRVTDWMWDRSIEIHDAAWELVNVKSK